MVKRKKKKTLKNHDALKHLKRDAVERSVAGQVWVVTDNYLTLLGVVESALDAQSRNARYELTEFKLDVDV